MTCRACKRDHSPLENCNMFARRTGIVQAPELSNQNVTTYVTQCNQCVTKEAEIERLRNQIEQMQRPKAKRDRAEYMREYRRIK